MPRMVAPPPSGEFNVKLTKPFSGHATHTVEVIGQPNRPANVNVTHDNGGSTSEKTGQMSTDDVRELMSLISDLRGLPSAADKDIYGLNARLDLATFDIQWSNGEEDPSGEAAAPGEPTDEDKDTFKRVVQSIEALGRQFAKKDRAI